MKTENLFGWRKVLVALCRSVSQLSFQPVRVRPTRLLLLLAFLALPYGALAQFNYLTNGGRVTITGYIGAGGDVEIPEAIDNMPVVGIGAGAFNNNTTIISVGIPNTVTKIGANPFGGCINLQAINVSALNTNFSSSAGLLLDKSQVTLVQCPGGSIGSFSVPLGITTLGDYAFYQCVYLTDITLPSGVVTIGNNAFYGCSNLASVNLSQTVATLGQAAFYGCVNLGAISLPNSVSSLGVAAFADCTGLSSIVLPNSVSAIPSQVFSGCSNLANVTIPDGVTSIGTYAFQNCSSLARITIPGSVNSIGDYAFSECAALTTIAIPSQLTKLGNNVFSGCSGLKSVAIPVTIKSIGDYTFADCTSLTSITLPGKVASVGDYTFSGCTSLTSFSATNSLTTMGIAALSGCTSLYQVRMPAKLTALADRTFSGCTSLTNIVLKTRIKSIGNYAFSGCTSLPGLTIPGSVKSVGNDAFYGCTGLLSITVPSSVKTLGDEAFYGCVSLQSVSLKGVQAVGNSVFYNCTSLTNAAIPGSASSIGGYGFFGCTSLASVSLTGRIKTVGDYAFAGCSGIKTAKLGNSITSLGDYAFANCTSLSNVTLPTRITSTGNYTFFGCTNLSDITIPNGVTRIGDYAFYGCSNLDGVTISKSVTSIGTETFAGCSSLIAITIPDKVATMAYQALGSCTGLTSVLFLGNPPSSVDPGVFDGSPNVMVYYYYKSTGWNGTLAGQPAVSVAAPIIIQQPSSQSATIGGRTSFSVNPFGPPTLKYQWQFNGANIAGARNGSYVIKSVQAKDAGSYQVTIANGSGSITSAPAFLTIQSAALSKDLARSAISSVASGLSTSPATVEAAGVYKGLITALTPSERDSSGAFTLTTSSDGNYSAKLLFTSQSVSVSGTLQTQEGDSDKVVAKFSTQLAGRAVDVALSIALDGSTAVSGSITTADSAELLAQFDGAMIDNVSESRLLKLSASSLNAANPSVLGNGVLSLSDSGGILNLRLADKDAVVGALTVDRLKDGRIPVFSPLYSKRGFLQGWLTLSSQQTLTSSTLDWYKEPRASATAFPQGFDLRISVTDATVQN